MQTLYNHMKAALCAILLLLSFCVARAQLRLPIPLWPKGATPGAHGTAFVDTPTVTPYLATNATGAAMLVCPGGGYHFLSWTEGNDYALWLNQHGVTCFVLKSRLEYSHYHYPAQFEDVTRAMRWVRAHAGDYHIDPHRIGIIGSSAGGHLASMVLTRFDEGDTNSPDPVERYSSRPDLGILCYPVITMTGEFVEKGTRANLLGTNPPVALAEEVSSQLHVTTNTPPCFIWCSYADDLVPMENSMMFAEALRKNHVPLDLHIYENGRHGMGLGDAAPFVHPHPWTSDCLVWLELHQFVKK